MLRTLRFGCSSRGQLRKYRHRVPGKGLCPLHSRQPFKTGWTLNFLCRRPFPRDRAQQSERFGHARPLPSGSPKNGVSGLRAGRSERPCQHRRLRRRASAVQRRRGGHLTPRRAKFRVKPFLKGLRFPKAEPLVHPSETWRVQARSLVAALRAAKPVPAPQ